MFLLLLHVLSHRQVRLSRFPASKPLILCHRLLNFRPISRQTKQYVYVYKEEKHVKVENPPKATGKAHTKINELI